MPRRPVVPVRGKRSMFPLSLLAGEHDIVVGCNGTVSFLRRWCCQHEARDFLGTPFGGDVVRNLLIPGLVSAKNERMSGLEEDKGIMTGKLDARRKRARCHRPSSRTRYSTIVRLEIQSRHPKYHPQSPFRRAQQCLTEPRCPSLNPYRMRSSR